MILLVGLGNPGDRYRDTRHNVGFMALDLIAERWGRPPWRSKFHAETAQVDVPGGREDAERAILLKPQTYMNRSGDSVQPAAAFYKVRPENVVVVHDELDLPFGQVRLKAGGGAAGHNGLRSISLRLGTNDYTRVRIGIGRPPPDFHGSGADYVLQGFSPAEQADLAEVVQGAASAIEMFAREGLSAAMNTINRRAKA